MANYEDNGHHDKKTGQIMVIGLIGCGIWGKNILRELISLNIDVKVVDSHPVIKAELADTHPQLSVNSLDELSLTDGIILASPSATHRQILEQIIPWNLPIFVEKPLTTSLGDAKAIQQIAHNNLFMMHIWRYHAGIQLLGEIARTHEIGNVTALYTSRCNWTSPRTDTDSVWNLAPHDLTIAIEILGHVPTPIAVSIEWHNGMARGMTALLGETPFVQIEVSNRSVTKRREVRLHGTEGIAVLTDEKVDYVDIFYGNDHSYPSPIRQERRYFDSTPPLKRELMAFVGFLNGGPAPISSFQEGIDTVEILSQLHQMAK